MNPFEDLEYVETIVEGTWKFYNNNQGITCMGQVADIQIKQNSSLDQFYQNGIPTKRTIELFIINVSESLMDMCEHYKKAGKNPDDLFKDSMLHFQQGVDDEAFATRAVRMRFKEMEGVPKWDMAEWNNDEESFKLAIFSSVKYVNEHGIAEANSTVGIRGEVPMDFFESDGKVHWWTVDMVCYQSMRQLATLMHQCDRDGTWSKQNHANYIKASLSKRYKIWKENESTFEVI